MKTRIEGIGEVVIQEIPQDRVIECAKFLISVYKHEGIWTWYTLTHAIAEFSASFSGNLLRPHYMMATLDGKVIGTVGWQESFMSCHGYELSFAAVDPTYQKKGLGTLLLTLAIKDVLKHHKDPVFLTETRQPLLFERFGFQRLHSYEEFGEHVFMICPFNDLKLPL